MSDCKCADDNERESNNIDDGNANLKKDGEPFKALSSSHAGQQLLTGEGGAAGLIIIIMSTMMITMIKIFVIRKRWNIWRVFWQFFATFLSSLQNLEERQRYNIRPNDLWGSSRLGSQSCPLKLQRSNQVRVRSRRLREHTWWGTSTVTKRYKRTWHDTFEWLKIQILEIQLNIQYLQCDDNDSLSPWVKPGFYS